jgi:hypothetical protein
VQTWHIGFKAFVEAGSVTLRTAVFLGGMVREGHAPPVQLHVESSSVTVPVLHPLLLPLPPEVLPEPLLLPPDVLPLPLELLPLDPPLLPPPLLLLLLAVELVPLQCTRLTTPTPRTENVIACKPRKTRLTMMYFHPIERKTWSVPTIREEKHTPGRLSGAKSYARLTLVLLASCWRLVGGLGALGPMGRSPEFPLAV